MIKTTIVGYNASDFKLKEVYTDRLDHYLHIYYPNISWSVREAIVHGATSREYVEHLSEKVLCHRPNIVIIWFSSNDIDLSSKKFNTLTEFEEHIKQLIEHIKAHNNRTGLNGCTPIPILVTPVPVNEDITAPARTNNRLKQYTYVIKKVAKEKNIPYVDAFNLLLEMGDFKTSFLEEDGETFTQKTHDLIYDMIFIELTKLINYQGVLKDETPIPLI
ncbi:MAG: SGNH/GDSL hydrolase family protein [Cellulosilyticaceae bacterium]